MKKIILFIAFVFLLTTNIKAQFCDQNDIFTNYYGVDTNYFQMDTTNLWQLGVSQKILLNSTFISLMTDTIYNYPSNTNSSVIIEAGVREYYCFLEGRFKVNTDTIVDYWTIYISHDYGTTWYDLTDSSFCYLYNIFNQGTPFVKSGNSPDESYFKFVFTYDYFHAFNLHDCDPVLFKFQFVSDSINNNKEGVQIWHLALDTYVDFINENDNVFYFKAFPNPASTQLNIEFEKNYTEDIQLEIQNILGQTVYSETVKPNVGNQLKVLDVSMLQNGVYFIQLKNNTKFSSSKFVKNN